MLKLIVIFFVVWIVSFFFGAIGWAQIIGSLQNIHTARYGWISILLWLAILVGLFLIAFNFFWDYKWAYIAAMVLSFLGNCRKQV